jgi:hypothetical protein
MSLSQKIASAITEHKKIGMTSTPPFEINVII